MPIITAAVKTICIDTNIDGSGTNNKFDNLISTTTFEEISNCHIIHDTLYGKDAPLCQVGHFYFGHDSETYPLFRSVYQA